MKKKNIDLSEQADVSANRRNGGSFQNPENGNMVFGCPTSSSIIANIILNKGFEGFIEYSTKGGVYNKKTPVFKTDTGEPIELTLTNLKENSDYFCKLNIRKNGEADFFTLPESRFSTKKNKNTSFTFGVQGDSHPERAGKMFNSKLYSQTLDLVSQKSPDFYFLLGDDFSLDKFVGNNQNNKQNVEQVYKNQRFYLGNAGKNPPLFLVNGNHEQAAKYLLDGSPNNIAMLATLSRNKYFPQPSPGVFYSGDQDTIQHIGLLKDYYSFEWGNALFVVIDPYWHSDIPVDNQPGDRGNRLKKDPWGITLGKTQYNWMKRTLETSKAKFKFVFAHHVNGTGRGGVERAKFFEWGGYDQDGLWQFDKKRPGWELPIHQLMVKNNVTIFFQGHDHLFAKQELDGVIYQTVPIPADDTHTAFNRESFMTGNILPNSGFLNVTVHPKKVMVEYIRSYFIDNKELKEDVTSSFTYVLKNNL